MLQVSFGAHLNTSKTINILPSIWHKNKMRNEASNEDIRETTMFERQSKKTCGINFENEKCKVNKVIFFFTFAKFGQYIYP